jgi:hypothetical protein
MRVIRYVRGLWRLTRWGFDVAMWARASARLGGA